MNRKRNVNFIKPDDPPFLKVLKKQAGYDDKNHKFDELENREEDFVNDDDTELPQVVVLKEGDLTAEQAEVEKERIKKTEFETKADLSQRVIFKNKKKVGDISKKKHVPPGANKKLNKNIQLLSFTNDDDEDEDDCN